MPFLARSDDAIHLRRHSTVCHSQSENTCISGGNSTDKSTLPHMPSGEPSCKRPRGPHPNSHQYAYTVAKTNPETEKRQLRIRQLTNHQDHAAPTYPATTPAPLLYRFNAAQPPLVYSAVETGMWRSESREMRCAFFWIGEPRKRGRGGRVVCSQVQCCWARAYSVACSIKPGECQGTGSASGEG